MPPKLLTYADAADLFGVSHWTIRLWVREKRIRCVKVNERVIRFRRADLERDIEKMTERSA